MLDNITAEYFHKLIFELGPLSYIPLRKKFLKLRSIFREIFIKLTENEKQYFSSNFSRVIFILDKKNIDKTLSLHIKKLNYLLNKAYQSKEYDITEEKFNYALDVLTKFINDVSQNDNKKPKSDYTKIKDYKREYNYPRKSKNIDFLQAVVLKKLDYNNKDGIKYAQLKIDTNEFDEITLQLDEKWLDIWKIAWKGALLNLFDLKIDDSSEIKIRTSSNSLIVIEPDFLVDTTDISECFHSYGNNPYIYFLKKFKTSETSLPLIIGNIANFIFDELITNPEADFDTLFEKALKYKPLQIFALASKGKAFYNQLKETSYNYYNIIKQLLPDLNCDYLSVEPMFISPKYGIQGRLDALMEYSDDNLRKDIVELKSGNAPSVNLTCRLDDKIFTTGIWMNHLAQTTCYNLLLDSTFVNRRGTSQLLYLKTDRMPLRNAPNIIQMKSAVINCRNWIVALERSLMLEKYTLFNDIDPDKFGNKPTFLNQDISSFNNIYKNLSQIELDYFHVSISFILREAFTEKIGSGSNDSQGGFAKLWKESLHEKEEKFSALTNLVLQPQTSDFINLHLNFKPSDDLLITSSFRKGDICILYPSDGNDYSKSFELQLIKVILKDISADSIIVSLRNKNYNPAFFKKYSYWIIEPDYIESSNKKLINSLYSFFCSDKEKKEIILGLRPPEFYELNIPEYEWLNPNQNEILRKALSAKNYYLVQGPPGTGKTSYLLKAIVKYLIESTNENLLILAYTNRAVDEICSTLTSIQPNIEFLRLGSKVSGESNSRLIAHLAEIEPLDELYKRIKATRIIISTVASVLYNNEIFEILNFDTAIIDEASQILEIQIVGILSKVNKFIMIGDEKQLPAIITQSEKKLKVDSDTLNSIFFNDFRCSLFERLIRICTHNNWNAYGMLRKQARMHLDIQEFPNKFFYGNKLDIFNPQGWQDSSINYFHPDSPNLLEKYLASKRILFIESNIEPIAKVNKKEAAGIKTIIECIVKNYNDYFNDKTIGIITPYRAQCTEISKHLPKEYRHLITIDTVERFQGSERDIIIISFAVNFQYQLNNLISPATFNDSVVDRKLNVAITRAKQHLIILGNSKILSQNNLYKQFVDFIKEKGGYIDSVMFDKIISQSGYEHISKLHNA